MEIITQSIDTRPIIFEHIMNGIEKIKKSGEMKGVVNLSLDLTRPNKIEVEISTKEDTYDLFILLRHIKMGKVVSEIGAIPYNDTDGLSEAIDSIIMAAELKEQKDAASYDLALEQLNRLAYRVNDIKDIIACRNDPMIAAHKQELNRAIAISTSLLNDIREFVSDRLKEGGI